MTFFAFDILPFVDVGKQDTGVCSTSIARALISVELKMTDSTSFSSSSNEYTYGVLTCSPSELISHTEQIF